MVTNVLPTSSGTFADQAVVPEAVPESPFEVLHFTADTPTLSLAVPEIRMDVEEVEAIVVPGETMLRDGGVVSTVGGLDGGWTGGCTGGCTGGGTGGCTGGGTGGCTGGGTGVCEPAAP
jgi:hypothetical protein